MKTRLFLALFLISITLFGEQGVLRLWKIKQRARELKDQNLVLVRHNDEMAVEIGRLRQPEYLERLIREERGYVREGERLLELPKSP